MQRNNLSLRVHGHTGQNLPNEVYEVISEYIINLR